MKPLSAAAREIGWKKQITARRIYDLHKNPATKDECLLVFPKNHG